MANWPKFGFTLFAQRSSGKLTVCRGLHDREAAARAALQFAKIRPIGLQDLFIRCEATSEQWPARDVVEAVARRATDETRPAS